MGLGKTVETIGKHSLDMTSAEAFCKDLGHRLGFNIIYFSYYKDDGDEEIFYDLGYTENVEVVMAYNNSESNSYYFAIDKISNYPLDYIVFHRSGYVLTFTEYSSTWTFFTEALICNFTEYNDRSVFIEKRNQLISLWKKLGSDQVIIFTDYNYQPILDLDSSEEYFLGKDLNFLKNELIKDEEIRFFDFASILDKGLDIPDPYQHLVNAKDKSKHHAEFGIMFHDDFREVK